MLGLLRLRADDPLARVEEAVEAWARSQVSYRWVQAYRSVDSTCRDAASPEHWDDAGAILERRVDALLVNAVSGAMDSLRPLQRAVIWAVYANRAGPAVWRVGSLAGMTEPEIVALHRGALASLRPLLAARGVMV